MENQELYFSILALLGIGGITFKLVLQRMDKQESRAALDIATLRTEIATTKADANAATTAATTASKDSVASTALAAKEQVASSAAALRDQVASANLSSKELLAKTEAALNDKILAQEKRIEVLEKLIKKSK